MVDTQELGQNPQVEIENPVTILDKLRSKTPPLLDLDTSSQQKDKTVIEIRSKFDDLLQNYPESPSKQLVTDLLADTMTEGCLAFGIDPIELILGPKQLGDHIAAAERKTTGPFDIKHLFIDPYEIMFRVDLLSRHGISTSKNITDIAFVFMHEMTHLGQAIHAENELKSSKQFDYANRPTEKHADEVALAYCRKLYDYIKDKPKLSKSDELLLQGLPETIKEAETNRRPLM